MSMGDFRTDDGCRIAYDYRPLDGAPVLMLSPSLGTAMALFDTQAGLGATYSLLLYDPRGHGQSDVPAGRYSMDRLGRDAVELLDHLGIERTHYAGVSLGGMVGQWLGYRAPERLNKLILAHTSAYMGPPSGWAARIDAVLAGGMGAVRDAVIERWFTPAFRAASPEQVSPIAAMLGATAPTGYAGCSAAIMDMDLRPTAKLITAPTLVISGLQDPATPPEHAQWLADNISGAKLASIDAAHLGNVELPEQFNALVEGFLSE